MAQESETPLDPGCGDLDELLIFGSLETRRQFIRQVAGTSIAITIGLNLVSASAGAAAPPAAASPATAGSDSVKVNFKINGKDYTLEVDPRTTLLEIGRASCRERV